jgi:uncharacterized membrane protein YbhN (UPF0104 family)
VAVPAVTGVLDRLLDLIALAILAACGILLSGNAQDTPTGDIMTVLGCLLVLGIPLIVVFLTRMRAENLPGIIRTPGAKLIKVIDSLRDSPRPALNSLFLALVVQLAFVALNYSLGVWVGISAPLSVWLLAWPLAKIAALLPVSLGGLGVREAALAALLAPFAVPGTLAVAEALVWQSVLFGFGLLAGSGILFSRQKFLANSAP